MLRVHVTYIGDPEMAAKEINPIAAAAMAKAVMHRHRTFLRRHFEPGPSQRYGYAKRTARYMIRKARSKHHQNPLVWSGDMKKMLLQRVQLQQYKTQARAKGIYRGPRYLWMAPTGNQPDMIAELMTDDGNELKELAVMVDAEVTAQLNALRTMRKKQIA